MATLKPEGAAERATLAILYVETRGFTRMSEILEPAIVFACIAEFFALVSGVAGRHEGIVRSMLNDTLLATFAGPRAAPHAAAAAQEIQREFSALEEAWRRDYGFRTAVAMGLHSGDAVLGKLGAPLPDHVLIIGDSVSIAERLLHRARAGEFVLSKALMDELEAAKFSIDADAMPALALSRRDPIEIFSVKLDTRLDFTD